MERTLVTVNPEGQLVLPSHIPAALGFGAGEQVEVLSDGKYLTLSPKRARLSAAELDRALTELQGMFKGQPSLEDDLYASRREEEEHAKRKYGW